MPAVIDDGGSPDAGRQTPPSAARIQAEAVRGSLWTVLSTVLGLPLGILSVVAAARLLTVGDFGRYTYYSFLIPLTLQFLDFGLAASLHWSATTGRASDHEQVVR